MYYILQRNMLSSEQTWHTVCCALQPKQLTATQYSSEYLFILLMFSSIKSQSLYKRKFYVSLSSSFSICPFQPIITFCPLQVHIETGSQPDASMNPEHVFSWQEIFMHIAKKRICLYPLPPKYMPEMLLKLP
jgi:hypothetical protein